MYTTKAQIIGNSAAEMERNFSKFKDWITERVVKVYRCSVRPEDIDSVWIPIFRTINKLWPKENSFSIKIDDNEDFYRDLNNKFESANCPGERAAAEWRILIACYGRFIPTIHLNAYAGHAPGAHRDLIARGFTYLNERDTSGVIVRGGQPGRYISGFVKPLIVHSDRNRLTRKQKKEFLVDKVCKFTGFGDSRRLQIDHKRPRAACIKYGFPIPDLTIEMVASGEWVEWFNIVSPNINTLKNSFCTRCLDGKEINIPEGCCRRIYASYYNETTGCKGCHQHDPLVPLKPQEFHWCGDCTKKCQNVGKRCVNRQCRTCTSIECSHHKMHRGVTNV